MLNYPDRFWRLHPFSRYAIRTYMNGIVAVH